MGAPNIQDFAPFPGSLLHIKEPKDVESVAKTIKYLAENPGAYNESLRSVSIGIYPSLFVNLRIHCHG